MTMKRNQMERQYRSFMSLNAVPNDSSSPAYRVRGQAVVFNSPTVIFEWDGKEYFEQIDPLAFAECDMSDVIMLYDHRGMVVARTRNNTLSLDIDDKGLWTEAHLNGTEAGRELYEAISGGYVDRMSFSFTVAEGGEEYDPDTRMWTVKRIKKLYDVSAVATPAYDQTSISARSAEYEYRKEQMMELELRRKKLIAMSLL